MIFRSFSNNDDGFLSKIGIYKKSFKEIGEACGKALDKSYNISNSNKIYYYKKGKVM